MLLKNDWWLWMCETVDKNMTDDHECVKQLCNESLAWLWMCKSVNKNMTDGYECAKLV